MFLYTFTMGSEARVFNAESLSGAIQKMSSNNFFTFMLCEIIYISSNDPKAPKQEMKVIPQPFSDFVELRPLDNLEMVIKY